MWLAAKLPHHGFDREREFALLSKLGTFLFSLIRFNQIHPAIGTLHQIVINVCAAITTFDFIVSGWWGEAGGHERIVSQTIGYERQDRHCEEKLTGSPIISLYVPLSYYLSFRCSPQAVKNSARKDASSA